MNRLNVADLSVGYDEQIIINNLTIKIPDKKITTIIGSNGCGKSTLLKAMTRLNTYQTGAVLLDGVEIHKMNTKQLAKKMAILPQNTESANGLTVAELVSYGRFPHQKGFQQLAKKDLEVIDWALDVTGTNQFKNRLVDELSGGQRQRVWIALALAQETDIIFLDEPTTYLDMAHQLEVLELLQRLNEEQGRTIIMVLHDLNQAARFADYIIAMKEGEIVKAGSCEEVINQEVLKKVFHIHAEIVPDSRTKKPICLTYHLVKGEK